MEEILVEIPEEHPWEPPVLRREEEAEEPHSSPADAFFIQYAVCMFLLTALLILRLFDPSAYADVTGTFRAQSNAPDLPWAAQLIARAGNLWK